MYCEMQRHGIASSISDAMLPMDSMEKRAFVGVTLLFHGRPGPVPEIIAFLHSVTKSYDISIQEHCETHSAFGQKRGALQCL